MKLSTLNGSILGFRLNFTNLKKYKPLYYSKIEMRQDSMYIIRSRK